MKKIEIKGHIVPDDHIEVYQWFGISATSPSLVKTAIAEAEAEGEKELLIEINSGGGSVWAGAEIYYALKKFDGTVKGEIPSLAASAATFIGMACDHLSMSMLAQFMIHGASTWQQGNHQNMADASDFLKNIDDSIISSYLTKTSLSREEIRELMNKDTWMTAQQAYDKGFIDEILFVNSTPDAVASVGSADNTMLLSQDVIDKVKAEILASKTVVPDPVNVVEPQPINLTNKKEDDVVMDLQMLQNEHPELFNQVKNMGYEEGVNAENARIKEIEDLAMPGNETLVNAAKFENKSTAADLAVAIVKAEKQKGANFLDNRKEDAAPLNDVPGTQENPVNTDSKEENLVNELTNIWGGKK